MDEPRDAGSRRVGVTPACLLWLLFLVVVAGTAVLVFGLPGGPPSAKTVAAAGASTAVQTQR